MTKIEKIVEVELESQKNLADAQTKAEQIKTDAKILTDSIIEKAKAEAKQLMQVQKNLLENTIESDKIKIKEEYEKKRLNFEAAFQKNSNKTVDLIINEILKG